MFHVVLKKMEHEKHRKYITDQLYDVLIENSVKSDSVTLSLLYERYLKCDGRFDRMSKELEKGKPVTMVKDEDLKVLNSHKLITEKEFKVLMGKKDKK